MRALAKGNLNCNARYHVGLIHHTRKDRQFTEYFLGTGACLEQTVRGLEKELAAVNSMDLADGEKQALRGRLQAMVRQDKVSAASLISNMLQRLEKSEIANPELYKNLLSEILRRIRPDAPTEK